MEKRELPTRHNFLTEAVKNLLESKITSNEPFIDSNSKITITSDPNLLNKYEKFDIPVPRPLPTVQHTPRVTRIKPISKKSCPNDAIQDEYYLKRHRRHEKEEKTQKNREKERLKHGYYQQKQLVERIKTMETSLLQSIVSSIRHRTHHTDEWEEDAYLDDLHCRLLNDAVEHLRRYEVLGLSNNSRQQQHETTTEQLQHNPLHPTSSKSTNDSFHKALQSEAIKQRSRQIKSFSKQPMFAGDSIQRGSRRSTRHVMAFGQRVPEFDTVEEFRLPSSISEYNKQKKKV